MIGTGSYTPYGTVSFMTHKGYVGILNGFFISNRQIYQCGSIARYGNIPVKVHQVLFPVTCHLSIRSNIGSIDITQFVDREIRFHKDFLISGFGRRNTGKVTITP